MTIPSMPDEGDVSAVLSGSLSYGGTNDEGDGEEEEEEQNDKGTALARELSHR